LSHPHRKPDILDEFCAICFHNCLLSTNNVSRQA
jgi:hypothetical protein